MGAAVLVESTHGAAFAGGVDAVVASADLAADGYGTSRDRDLQAAVASIESAAAGLGIVLLLALFGVVFTVAALTGVLA